ncbi:MAG: ABC-F family ATP-binding cassette domain-containing protein [Bacillota bacterium]|nr:ABC-F family ATP-binding cassette domain-containing protein [Bacillota bacterium]
MIALSCNNIHKSYGIETILEDISFTISVGDKVGLIGVNGAGKTTLIKILTGIESKDDGEIFISKDMSIGYLEQNTRIDLTISAFDYCEEIYADVFEVEKQLRALEIEMQNIQPEDQKRIFDQYTLAQERFEAMDGYAVGSRIRGILNGLGFEEIDHHKPINQLSGGQKSRIGIARLLLKQPDILFLDEPTNHLDIDAIKWLENYLKDYTGTIVMISHDRYFLDQVATKIFEIESGELVEYTGNYTHFIHQKNMQYEADLKRFEVQSKEIQKQEEIIRRFKGHGTEKLAKRAKSREKRLAHTAPLERPKLFRSHFKIDLKAGSKSGKDVLKVEDLKKTYDHLKVFENVSFEIYKGERIGLIGPNGVGKTTLFKILISQLEPDEGTITWGHHVMPGYYDQELRNLHLEKSILEEIHDDNPALSLTAVRSLLGAFLFTNDDIEKKINQLSGGERSRVSLLKLMLSTSNILFLDEPTNHLDLYSKETLEDALLGYDGTLVSISHDRYFLNKICSKIFEMTPEGLIVYWGNYDYYQEKKSENLILENPVEEKPVLSKTKQKDQQKREKEILIAEKRKRAALGSLEEEIESLEDDLHTLELSLCVESVFSDPERSLEVQREIVQIKDGLNALYMQLDEMLEKL